MSKKADLEKKLKKRKKKINKLKAKLKAYEGISISPFAPKQFPQLSNINGVRFATTAAGVKYEGRTDLMAAHICKGASMAGVFTKSLTRSAPVEWSQKNIQAKAKGPQLIIVNSGNANAFTGKAGMESVEATAKAAAKSFGVKEKSVFIASTGVIGEKLPHAKITAKFDDLNEQLWAENWEQAARAIMTTDTYPKGATATTDIDGTAVSISGFAKGAGMIAPDMATMLVFIFTDANISPDALQSVLMSLTEPTFNSISIDSDTSTSDTLLLSATCKAKHKVISDPKDRRLKQFKLALQNIMQDLATQVVKDGEGVSKVAQINISGAKSKQAAKKIGLSIANSPLVKTAMAGNDPNWGRIVMAIGKSGQAADRDAIKIQFGDILVAENGWVSESYTEDAGAEYFEKPEIEISVDVGVGRGKATVWTCDLTHGYVSVNADYRS